MIDGKVQLQFEDKRNEGLFNPVGPYTPDDGETYLHFLVAAFGRSSLLLLVPEESDTSWLKQEDVEGGY